MRHVLTSLFLIPVALAQDVKPDTKGAVIAGKVVDEETGKGIPGVGVMFTVSGAQPGSVKAVMHGKTDDTGSFRLVVPAGSGAVRIAGNVPGYFLQSHPRFGRGEPKDDAFTRVVAAKLDTPVENIVFKLGKGLSVSGRVLDAEGKPVAGAKLARFADYRVNWDQPIATTDADGKYAIPCLDPQRRVDLFVRHDERRLAGAANTQPKKEPKRIDGFDIRVEPFATVTGKVVDQDKKPLAGIRVFANISMQFEEEGQRFYTSFPAFSDRVVESDKAGKFVCEFLIPGMPHSTGIQQEGYALSFSSQFTPKAGEQHDIGQLMLLRIDQTVAGTVVDPIGKPLSGIRVYATSRNRTTSYVSSEQVTTDKDGRFKLGKLPRGSIELNALSPADEKGISISNRMLTETGKDDVRIVLFLRRTPPAAEALAGKPAPEFPVASWHGGDKLGGPRRSLAKAFQRADFAGKVVVLAFVDEAKPSTLILPQLKAIQEKLGDKVVVLRVHELGDAEELAKLSPLPAAMVPAGIVPGYAEAHQKYGVRATPTLFLIDGAGVLRQVDIKVEELEAVVRKVMGQ